MQGWTERGKRWAQFQIRAGSEAFNAARLEGRQPAAIKVRRDSLTRTVTPAWRVVDLATGQAFAVLAAADLDRRREFVTLTCEAVVT